MNKSLFLLTFFIIFSQSIIYAQGCSDAGFCSAGSLASNSTNDTTFKHYFKLTFSYGSGENSTSIFNLIPEAQFKLYKNNFLQVQIPYVATSGNLGNNSGVGDVLVSATSIIVKKKNFNVAATAGIKLPTGSTDELFGSTLTLPMPYQTGLGTTDLVLGISTSYNKWKAVIGYQGVLKNENKNTFAHYNYSNNSDADKYFESNMLDRGDDVLIRIEKLFNYKRFDLTPGILGIWRLTEDKVNNASGVSVPVNGSDGLTLNLTASAIYNLSNRVSLSLLYGFPLIVRDSRNDGLTRSFVFNTGIKYNFGL